MSRPEPSWLHLEQVLRIHEDAIARHGASAGVRSDRLLHSALARPLNAFVYGAEDLFSLAALYAEGILRNHPFVDGNKRTGYNAAALFLLANGYRLQVALDADQRVAFFEKVAAGSVATEELAQFYRETTVRRIDASDA